MERSFHICSVYANLHTQTHEYTYTEVFDPFLAATKQLYEWFSPSVRLSVCLSVRLSVTPF